MPEAHQIDSKNMPKKDMMFIPASPSRVNPIMSQTLPIDAIESTTNKWHRCTIRYIALGRFTQRPGHRRCVLLWNLARRYQLSGEWLFSPQIKFLSSIW